MFSEPKFYNNNGDLTAYALACGYIETAGAYHGGTYWAMLYHEHDHYQVKYSLGEKVGYTEHISFTTLAKARKYFSNVSRIVWKELS